MRKRLIGLLLALCYLSVSLSFSSSHFHKHGDGLLHQCAACAWHLESHSDEPTGQARLEAPTIATLATAPLISRLTDASLPIHSARGPPFLS